MVSAKLLARYLAREVSYRGFREGGRGLGSATFVPREPRKRVSAFESNVFGAVVYGLLSSFLGAFIVLGSKAGIDASIAFSAGLTILDLLAMLLLSMHVTSFTSTFVREGVVDLVRVLPIDSSTAFRAYLVALYLYWGALSISFLFIPYLAIAIYAAARGALSVAQLCAGFFSAATSMAFATFVGMALGASSYLARKRVSLRVVSTVGWLATFVAVYASYYAMGRIYPAFVHAQPAIARWGALIPFLGPVYAYSNPLPLATSASITVGITLASLAFSRSRINAVLSWGAPSAPAAPRAVVPKARVLSPLAAMVLKDVKLLCREPRRLASMLFIIVFPVIMALANPGIGRGAWIAIGCAMGGFAGLSSDHAFFVEGSGAKLLYHLPIGRRFLAIAKSLSSLALAMPVALGAYVAISLAFSAPPTTVLEGVALAILAGIGVSLLNSVVTTSLLPRQPSEWTELSLRGEAGRGIAKSASRIALGIASTAPFFVAIAARGLHLDSNLVALAISIYAACMLCAGLLGLAMLRGDILEPA